MWWKSVVNLSFFLSVSTLRMRSSACDALARLCVRCPAIFSGAQFNLSLLATACRNQGLVVSLQRFGRRARAQALSSAKAAR